MTFIFIDYLYAAAPAGVGLTKVQASQIITLDAALASIFSSVGSFMADRVFGNRRAYRFCTIAGPFFYFSLAIPRRGIVGVVLYCCIGYMNSMVAGSSMYSLLGKRYAKGDERRDGAFSYIYVISNIGAAIPSISGTVALLFGYHAAFAFSAAAAIVGSAYYLLVERKVVRHHRRGAGRPDAAGGEKARGVHSDCRGRNHGGNAVPSFQPPYHHNYDVCEHGEHDRNLPACGLLYLCDYKPEDQTGGETAYPLPAPDVHCLLLHAFHQGRRRTLHDRVRRCYIEKK